MVHRAESRPGKVLALGGAMMEAHMLAREAQCPGQSWRARSHRRAMRAIGLAHAARTLQGARCHPWGQNE